MLNSLKIFLLIIVGIYLFLGLLIYLFQEKLIFLPEDLPSDHNFSFDIQYEEHFITMEDGAVINGLHFTQKESKGLILYFHGNAGNLDRWGEIVYPFVESGFEVFIVDYRGYGKSSGKKSNKAMLSDADMIYKYALQIAPEDKIILFGRSIGSSFASYLAGKNSPDKLILETPFYSLKDVANNVLPIFPTSLLLRYNFRNYKNLESCEIPIYIFHGTDDEIVPYDSGKKLYESLDGKQADFFTIDGGHHNDLSRFDPYWEAMNQVLTNE